MEEDQIVTASGVSVFPSSISERRKKAIERQCPVRIKSQQGFHTSTEAFVRLLRLRLQELGGNVEGMGAEEFCLLLKHRLLELDRLRVEIQGGKEASSLQENQIVSPRGTSKADGTAVF
jgi:hypothetical protein